MANPEEPDPRRVGDATRDRIDELADGWDGRGARGATDGLRPARGKPRTSPPPPPGARSARPKALGSAPSSVRPPGVAPSRRRRRSSPPPPPLPDGVGRAGGPPGRRRARPAASGTGPVGSRGDATGPSVEVAPRRGREDDPTVAAPPSASLLAVARADAPVREDSASVGEASASVREASASVREGMVPAHEDLVPAREASAPVREDLAPARPGSPGLEARSLAASGVPRVRGPLGDVRYAFHALFGAARARRELAKARAQRAEELDGRDDRLRAAARFAVAEPGLDHSRIGDARDRLVSIEERRSQHAGRVAAADEREAGLRRKRADALDRFRAAETAAREALDEAEVSLGPLEQRAAGLRKQLGKLERTAAQLEAKIARDHRPGRAGSAQPPDEAAEIEARLAALRAERESVVAQKPPLVADLERLEPAIAGARSAADAARRELDRLAREDRDDEARIDEKLAAAATRRQVEQRALDDSDALRDQVLLELGEWLDAERPPLVAPRLRGADEHATAIATLDRRIHELQQLVDGIDRGAVARGIAIVAAGAAALIAVVWLALR